jgi:glucose/arabinose dehydrogenase
MRLLTPLVAVALAGILLTLGSGRVTPAEAAFSDVTFSSETFVAGANFPASMAFAPDGRLFYNERCGAVRVVMPNGTLLGTPFATIPNVACAGDYGLLGLAFDPDYNTNHYVYVQYMRRTDDPSNPDPLRARAIVQRFTDVNNVGTAATEIINNFPETNPAINPNNYHGANNIHFGPDGKLYISLGENNNKPAARDVASPLGKILRVNKENGSAPNDNPFYNTPGADQRVYAMGLRNTFDFAFHPANGQLYGNENGFTECDELNIITAGGDYEWNLPFDPVTNKVLGPSCTADVGIEAIYYFRFYEWQDGWSSNSTSAPVGILAVHQDEMPALGHSFFVCEYRNSVLRLLQLGGANLDQVVAEPRIIDGGANSCRLDIEMSPSGDIYYSHLSEIRRLIIDSDSDTLEDKLDNCPNWPNVGQADPEWTVPPGDDDCDGFANARESYLSTDANEHCAADTAPNNESGADGWALDMNDNRQANTVDVGFYIGKLGLDNTEPGWTARLDLNQSPNGIITTVDVGMYVARLGDLCTPSGP